MIFGPLKLVFRLISLFVTVVVLYFAFGLVQIWMAGRTTAPTSADAIVVVGPYDSNGMVSSTLKARLDEAFVLYQQHVATRVVTVGAAPSGPSEAALGAAYLKGKGLPASGLTVVPAGTDLWTDAAAVQTALSSTHDLAVVTDCWQVYRAKAAFAAHGFTPESAPVGASGVTGATYGRYLGEAGLVFVGRLVGYGTVSGWTNTVTSINSQISGLH